MPRVPLPFNEWLPDQPALGNPGLTVADGVWPVANGFKPVGEFAPAINGTLVADCIGAGSARSLTGVAFTIAGTASNLYRYTSSGFVSVGSGYSASASLGWRMVQWGNLILATNGINPVQRLDMAAGSPAFGALAGSPPLGELISVVRDFVVLGRTGGNAQQLTWSGINNEEQWTGGVNQSGSQIMPTGGDILGITGGEFGIVLQQHRVVRMTYVGSPLVFQFDEVADNLGCVARGSVCRVGAMTYFLSHQGFARTDGNGVAMIGDEKINRTLLSLIDRSFFPATSCAVDPQNSLIMWAIPDATTSQTLFIYNYALDRWSTASQVTQRVFMGLSESTTLEELDAIYGTLEAVPASLDDDQWRGGYPLLMLIDGQRRLGVLSGLPKAARFQTGELPLAGGATARLRRARLLADTVNGVTVTVRGSQRRGEAVTQQVFTGVNRFGDVSLRSAWRYPRIEVAIAAGTQWNEATGIEVEFEGGGR